MSVTSFEEWWNTKWTEDRDDPRDKFVAECTWGAATAAERDEVVRQIMDAAKLFGDPLTSTDPVCTALVQVAMAVFHRMPMSEIPQERGMPSGEPVAWETPRHLYSGAQGLQEVSVGSDEEPDGE